MHDEAFREINFARYASWLRHVTGMQYGAAVCDSCGAVVWCDDPSAPAWHISLSNAVQSGSTDNGMQRHDEEDGWTILHMPLHEQSHGLLGHLAVRIRRIDPAPYSWDVLAEAMEDMAAAITDEYLLKRELNAIAGELSARYEELHLVYAMDQELCRTKSGSDIFNSMLRNFAIHMNADVSAFIRPADDFSVASCNLSKPLHNLDLVLVEMRGDLFRFVHSARQPVILNDMADPRRAYIFTDMPLKVLCCPVFQEKSVEAILVLVNHYDKPDFTNSDRKLGEVLANQFSNLSRFYRLMDESSRFNQQIARALIESVEAKDPYTRGHSERVHHIAMEIGRAMKLTDTELENLSWGSLLHDVGKIGIPDAVLCKPGRLTDDEYTFIKVHPERSYEILRHIDRLRGAVPGARHHQEKYDGTGYPHRLAGNDIPLSARIIAVADTYDSITSSRAYRPGRTHEKAMQEIQHVSGSQLDPAIVGIFKSLCAENPEWMKRFSIRREESSRVPVHAAD